MKQYTQSELQKMYMEPSEELKNRIHQEIFSLPIKEQEEEIVKKKLSFSFVSVIAILLALVAVAYAATEVYHRISVNWKGETVEETELPIGPEPTVIPPPDAQVLMTDEDLAQMADELLRKAVAEDEYGVVSYETAGGNMNGTSPIQKTFDSWDEFREYMKKLDEKKPVIVCGDMNVAHEEIDLKNPKTNHQNPGFTDEEREKMTALLNAGFIDTFRFLYPETETYSWWSYRFHAREKNVGWRIDYFLASEELRDRIKDAVIHTDIFGSDHCPVELQVEI